MTDNSYATEKRKQRRKGSGGTQEFFTPESLVNRMCDKIPNTIWADGTKTFLEPSAGNGNFIVEIIRRRIVNNVDWRTALNTLYSVELMQDNVDECHERVIQLLKDMHVDFDEDEARKIIKRNMVCSDFFKWDFENWKPMIEDTQLSLF